MNPSFIYILTVPVLILITYFDFKEKIVPDKLNMLLLVFGVVNLMFNFNINYILGFLIAGALYLSVAVISNGRLGGGDIKLIAVLGLLFGIKPIFFIIVISNIFAGIVGMILIISKKAENLNYEFPVAPYICFAALLHIVIMYLG